MKALAGIVAACFWSWALAGRIKSLTGFVDRLLEVPETPPKLKPANDELGELVHALSGIAPQVGELVNQLSTELTRREVILASMTDAVLAVDARLTVTFCNDAFLRAVGMATAEGVPLIKVITRSGLEPGGAAGRGDGTNRTATIAALHGPGQYVRRVRGAPVEQFLARRDCDAARCNSAGAAGAREARFRRQCIARIPHTAGDDHRVCRDVIRRRPRRS